MTEDNDIKTFFDIYNFIDLQKGPKIYVTF